jgi:hypothetical protein
MIARRRPCACRRLTSWDRPQLLARAISSAARLAWAGSDRNADIIAVARECILTACDGRLALLGRSALFRHLERAGGMAESTDGALTTTPAPPLAADALAAGKTTWIIPRQGCAG